MIRGAFRLTTKLRQHASGELNWNHLEQIQNRLANARECKLVAGSVLLPRQDLIPAETVLKSVWPAGIVLRRCRIIWPGGLRVVSRPPWKVGKAALPPLPCPAEALAEPALRRAVLTSPPLPCSEEAASPLIRLTPAQPR